MAKNLKLITLEKEDKNIEKEYLVTVEGTDEKLLNYIMQLLDSEELFTTSKEIKLTGDLRTYIYSQPPYFRNTYHEKHLYQPLLTNKNEKITIIPAGLNDGEAKFVDDLVEYLGKNPFPDKEIYLLRNSTKSKGVGFYAENTYYPDFIMWIKEKDQQRVLFIDPKGLTHISFDDQDDESKLNLHKHLKNEIQPDLERKDVKLDAFTISVTDWRTVQSIELKSIEGFAEDRHILFQYKDTVNNVKIENKNYIEKMFELTFSND